MTLNLKETGTNIRDVYTCLIRQEKDINTYGTYVDQEFSTLNHENTLKQIPYTSMTKEGGCNIQSSEGNNTYDGSSIKKINKEFRSTSDKGFNIESMSNFIFELDTLPRYGICEKSTQTILTMRDIDNLEAYKTIPTRELISNMFRTSPDMYFKIFGKYLNENIKCESSEILNKSENEDLINSNSSSKIELNKNRKNLKIKEEFFSNKNVTYKRNKGFNTSQTPDKIISRKRKYPINYNEFNKNGTNDKINVNENIKKTKINSFTNYDSLVDMSGNKNHNEQQPYEKKSDNKINIKRKIDYFKKTKIKIINKNPLIKSLNNLNKIYNPKNQNFDKDLKLEENVAFDNPIKNNSFDLGDNNSYLDTNKLKQIKFEALINQHQSDYFPGLNNLNNKNVNLDGYAIRQNQDEYFLSNNDISFQNNNQLNNFVNSSDKNYLDSENFAEVRNNNKCNSSKTKVIFFRIFYFYKINFIF